MSYTFVYSVSSIYAIHLCTMTYPYLSSEQVALAYAVGQSAPMVATGWGVFYYKEFNGAPNTAWGCLVAMVALYTYHQWPIQLDFQGYVV